MKTEDLVNQLTNNLEPVKTLETPVKRLIRWLCVSALCIAVGIFVMGLRHDFSEASSSIRFWLETILILASAISAALAAFILSVPGNNKKQLKFIPFCCIALWAATAVVLSLRQFGEAAHGFSAGSGMPCMSSIYILAVVPGAVLFAMICHAAPLNKPWVGILCVIAATALGALGLQFVCGASGPMHILVWHLLPVLVIGLLGIWLGKSVFNWDKKDTLDV